MQKCRGSSGGFETARGVLPAKPGGVGGGRDKRGDDDGENTWPVVLI